MKVRGLTLLAEVMLIGVLVSVASLPVVTVLAAANAGAVSLRELVSSERTPTIRRFCSLLATSLREPLVLAGPVLVAGVGALDALALVAGLPGGRVLGPLVAVALAFLVLAGIRGAARWKPGERWDPAAAATAVWVDWRGSLLLLGGLVALALVVSQAPGFAVIAPGLLVLAAVAVDMR